MEKFFSLTCIALAGLQATQAKFPFYNTKPFIHEPLRNLGNPLILTPLIEAGKIKEAKEASQVHLAAFQNVTSYSGYLTVDDESNGNLFFWFFPSANSSAHDPVVLWLQGGPGSPSLYGLFMENGPFIVEDNLVKLRQYSWHKNFSLLYIDQPVGTGYSFTDGEPPTDQDQVGKHLYSALTQFFTVFPEFQKNSFFVSGESYAGKYVPAISYAIHKNNPSAPLKINLQGLIIGNGLSDPKHQFKYGALLYQLGLIDLSTLESFDVMEAYAVKNIENGNYVDASRNWSSITSLIHSSTRLPSIYNYLYDSDNDDNRWESFVVQDEVRKALHVGNQAYTSLNETVYDRLYIDISRSVVPWIIELLSNYRVLIYNGHLDIIVSYVATENYLQNLNFSSAGEYKTAQRRIWHVNDKVAGYVKTAGNLTEVMVRNAGHMVPTDQPEVAHELIYKFVNNIPIVGT